MESLYSLVGVYKQFQEELESIPEEAIEDTLQALEGEIGMKIDALASIIKQLESEATMIDNEMKSLKERRDAKKRKVESIKKYIVDQMERADISKVETSRNLVSTGHSKRVVVDEEEFFAWAEVHGEEFISYGKASPNKIAIRNAIAEGKDIPHAHIEEVKSLKLK